MRLFLLVLSSLVVASATLGFDAAQLISSSTFVCMRNEGGYSFYVARVSKSNGQLDNYGLGSLSDAWGAEFTRVDAYIFPCHASSCPSAKDQVAAAINAVKKENSINAIDNANTDMLWLDIEIYNWPSNQTANKQFILDMTNQAVAMGFKVGIYTNSKNWQSIVGIEWSGVSQYPLWWAQNNGIANLDGFKSFGGWTTPTMHQFNADVKGPCGIGNIDQNYQP